MSVETIEEEYNYIRHHGDWQDFSNNINVISKLDHKISFNMLHFILNYKSIHSCVDYLKDKGFNDNSFVIGPLYNPPHLNTMNLPDEMMHDVLFELNARLDMKPEGYLKNSYENLLEYYTTTNFKKNMKSFYYNLGVMDQRRKQDARAVFPKLFKGLDAYTLE